MMIIFILSMFCKITCSSENAKLTNQSDSIFNYLQKISNYFNYNEVTNTLIIRLSDKKLRTKNLDAIQSTNFFEDSDTWEKTCNNTSFCNVKNLILMGNKIRQLPDIFSCFPNLERLFINDMDLFELPESIGCLKNLKFLVAGFNHLVELPVSIINLKSLKYLSLQSNNLEYWPFDAWNFPKIEGIFLKNNRFRYLPKKFIMNLERTSNFVVLDISENANLQKSDDFDKFGLMGMQKVLGDKVLFNKSSQFLNKYLNSKRFYYLEENQTYLKYSILKYLNYSNIKVTIFIDSSDFLDSTIKEILKFEPFCISQYYIYVTFNNEASVAMLEGRLKELLNEVSKCYQDKDEELFTFYDSKKTCMIPTYDLEINKEKCNLLLWKRRLAQGCLYARNIFQGGSFPLPDNTFIDNWKLNAYRCLGRLIGMALLEKYTLNIRLHKYIYLFLLNEQLTFENLVDYDLSLYNSLKFLLTTSIREPKETFTIQVECSDGTTKQVELKPNGSQILVTDDNKGEYINLYLKYKFYKLIQKQLEAIKVGFNETIPESFVKFYSAEYLEFLLLGQLTIDISEWKYKTEIIGFKKQELYLIEWFWEIVKKFSMEDKIKLYSYITGSNRVHCDEIDVFRIFKFSDKFNRLPIVMQGSNLICLSKYSSIYSMEALLKEGIRLSAIN